MKKRRLNQKGFTMVELIVVIAIIAILAVAGIMAFGNIQARARTNVAQSNAALLAGALNAHNALATTPIVTASLATVTTHAGLNGAWDTTVTDVLPPTFTSEAALANAVGNVNYNATRGWQVNTGAAFTPLA